MNDTEARKPCDPEPGRHVQKIQVAARVSQPSFEPRDGEFLLFPTIGGDHRPETLLELLNSSRTVLPFIRAGDRRVLLLTRANIDWVVVGKDTECAQVYPPDYVVTREQRVDLRFIDESHIHAVVQWNAGDTTRRLSDYLNECEAFIPARTTFGTLLLNKLRVRETLVEEGTGRPVCPTDALAKPRLGAPSRRP